MVTGSERVENFSFNGVTFTASQLINQAPVFSTTVQPDSIDENVGQTQPAWSFNAAADVTDPNNPTPGDVLTYSLVNDAGGRFQINASPAWSRSRTTRCSTMRPTTGTRSP